MHKNSESARELMSVATAARITGIDRKGIVRRAEAGLFRFQKLAGIRGSYLLDAGDVRAYAEKRAQDAEARAESIRAALAELEAVAS